MLCKHLRCVKYCISMEVVAYSGVQTQHFGEKQALLVQPQPALLPARDSVKTNQCWWWKNWGTGNDPNMLFKIRCFYYFCRTSASCSLNTALEKPQPYSKTLMDFNQSGSGPVWAPETKRVRKEAQGTMTSSQHEWFLINALKYSLKIGSIYKYIILQPPYSPVTSAPVQEAYFPLVLFRKSQSRFQMLLFNFFFLHRRKTVSCSAVSLLRKTLLRFAVPPSLKVHTWTVHWEPVARHAAPCEATDFSSSLKPASSRTQENYSTCLTLYVYTYESCWAGAWKKRGSSRHSCTCARIIAD